MKRFKSPIKSPHPIGSIELVPSGGGIFDVHTDEALIYSKFQTGRHAEDEEILEAIGRQLGDLG